MPRRVDHEQRRTEIALGVLAVVADGGLAAVSLRSVAEAAGVSMGRVQHYFGSKRELVLHACRTVMDLAEEQHLAAAGLSPHERIRHLLVMGIPTTVDGRRGVGVWYAFVVGAATDPELAGLVTEGWRNLRADLVSLLAEAGAVECEQLADALAAMVDGLVLRVALGSLTASQAQAAVERQLQAVLR
ncbi:transcriptional regulator [Enemella dayhoffiae]|uniref:Transcriptional regulator n=1 Tax=Enemella dayhoffiae TaxID=2016507 RepID=A0A255GMZ8_9ACTN|nr:TetR family transcriptional regulator C-terminal domain-containing protein [Enemella dayhoffiae]OYO17200.1 transcriptional regulator [Enemella dayhoffiae]